MVSDNGMIRVGTLEELKSAGQKVVSGDDRPIVVFYNDGDVRAVDNRCPHIGFPLSKGTVQDGILTCHWHHARFDLASGCTFDLFADDVPSCAVEIRGEEVWISKSCRHDDEGGHWRLRFDEGMARNIGLIVGKSVLALLDMGVDYRELVTKGVLFGASHRDGWASGMTILTAMANLVPSLPDEEKFLALYQGMLRVAGDCAGQPPRRERYPLETEEVSLKTLKRWFRYWTLVRHRDGGERTILTAIRNGASPAEVADILFSAVTDRYYADTGHALDFINKAFEVLDILGWEHAEKVLPTVVGQLVAARGGEELNAWRHPVDLVPLLTEIFDRIAGLMEQERDPAWDGCESLADALLGDDPHSIAGSLCDAIAAGALPSALTKSLCYAAILRIARFGIVNETRDWITTLHTFTYCNALHQSFLRVGDKNVTPDLMRGLFHGAMSIHLDRFLNIPPAPLPGERPSDGLDDLPTGAEELLAGFLEALNTQQQVDMAALLVARYLTLGHPTDKLFTAFARGVLREDANFHTFQMLEACKKQYDEWGNSAAGQTVLIALARYMAAHSPTQRAQFQTAEIALRLHRGEALYESDEDMT